MDFNILISSAGRRVGLMNCFRESLADLGISGRVLAVDITPYSAAAQSADKFYVVPRCTDPDFIPAIERICEREKVALVVPTIDTELPAYAEARDTFACMNTKVTISSSETISICYDKIRTHEWLLSKGFPAPRQASPSAVIAHQSDWPLPLIIKPIDGSGSLGVRTVDSFEELEMASRARFSIIQERVQGIEHTVNVFVNRAGKCVCTVPHARLETRSGEVSKGVTVRHRELMKLAENIAETLPGAYGALNVQCFVTPSGELKVIETNARFGGGYPLAHHAGARITRWLIEETLGREINERFQAWDEGLTMLRYDEAVYVPQKTLDSDYHEATMYCLRS